MFLIAWSDFLKSQFLIVVLFRFMYHIFMRKIVFCVYNCGIESFLILIFFLWKIKLTTNAIINLVRQRWLIFLNFFFFLSTVSYVKLANDQRCHQDGRQAIRRSYFWKQQTAPNRSYLQPKTIPGLRALMIKTAQPH